MLTLKLFGTLALQRDNVPLDRTRIRKDYWLLALLALRANRETERSFLAGTLWPDVSEENALFYLRRGLTGLRQVLGPDAPRLTSPSPRTLRLDMEGMEVDVLAFDAAVKRADPASLESAVELYRGDLLEGCDELWAVPERAARREAFVGALHRLASEKLASDPRAAIGYLRRAVTANSLNEPVQRALLEALAANGDFVGVQQAYLEFRRQLREEIQSDPAPETISLYHRIRAHARNEAADAPRTSSKVGGRPGVPLTTPRSRPLFETNLPEPMTSFIGREREIAETLSLLGRSRLLTLTGTGGVGKSRLALQAAREALLDFQDGVWLAELAPLADAGLVPQSVALALGLNEQVGKSFVQTLIEHLRDRKLLLVLDNCEHLLHACTQLVDALLRSCPHLKILATSREALGMAGEQNYRVLPLSLPDRKQGITVTSIDRYPAVRLFIERAMNTRADFLVTDAEAPALVSVCHRLDGIPLAIELAAARVRSLSLEEIHSRLDQRFRLLTGGSKTALPHQQTLRGLMDWSFSLLNPPERTLLARLSVFSGGWTLTAAEQVCSGPNTSSSTSDSVQLPCYSLPSDDVLDRLTSLVDKSLVLVEVQQGITRYWMLETVRQYSRERLAEVEGNIEALRARHRDYFLMLAEGAMWKLRGPEQAHWLAALEMEHDNLRQALAFCAEQSEGGEIGLRLAGSLLEFWRTRGHWSEGREQLAVALQHVGAQEHTTARATAINGAGTLAWEQRDCPAARSLHQECLTIRRALQDRRGIAESLNNLALVSWGEGDYALCRMQHEESLAIFRELEDKRGIAKCLNNLGRVMRLQGDCAAARILFSDALKLNRELGDRATEASNLLHLGILAQSESDDATAKSLYEESLAIFREVGDKRGIATTLNNLAVLTPEQGDLTAARAQFEESLAIDRELGDRQGIASCLNNLGGLARHRGDYAAARVLHEESLAIRRELRDKQGIALSLEAFSRLAAAESDMMRAVGLFSAASILRDLAGLPRAPDLQTSYQRELDVMRVALGEAAYSSAWDAGRTLDLEQAVALALEGKNPQPHLPSP